MNYHSLRRMSRPSFTLVEMVVVVGIILILSSLILSAVTTMWDQAHIANADQFVSNILKVAASRSRSIDNAAYGVFFYVDRGDRQVACFIKWRGYPDRSKEEHWPDVVHRFMIDTESGQWLHVMKNFVRISPLEILEWTDEQILNDNYRVGVNRNTFVIVFQRGFRSNFPVWIEDRDADEDGFGDLMFLPVHDVDSLGVVEDMLVDEDDNLLELNVKWGVLIYNESLHRELPEEYRPEFIRKKYTRALFMDILGRTIRGEK